MKYTINHIFTACIIAVLLNCASGQGKSNGDTELVRVATIAFVNTTGQETHDYLGGSLADATTKSMEQIFAYNQIPTAKTTDLYGQLSKNKGILPPSDLRAAGLEIDADLLIYGDFKVTKGKKGDTIEITMNAFRSDRAEPVAAIVRRTQVSNRIFDEIDKMTAELVQGIVAYRRQQMEQSGQREAAAARGGKIELTRDSINIAPFIPPIF